MRVICVRPQSHVRTCVSQSLSALGAPSEANKPEIKQTNTLNSGFTPDKAEDERTSAGSDLDSATVACGAVELYAVGNAVGKAVTVAEIVKRRLPGLFQITTVDSTTQQQRTSGRDVEGEDEFMLDGGSASAEQELLDSHVRQNQLWIPTLRILLSVDPLDQTLPGYQGPLQQNIQHQQQQ